MINFHNIDCMEFMKGCKDKQFDLAIVDPPYGIDVNKMQLGSGKYKTDKGWDNTPPDKSYFKELTRISKQRILWGANHYISKYPYDSSCWLIWDKNNGDSDFADCELAWTSFDCPCRKFTFNLTQQKKVDIKFRFHPTQKPIELYKWTLRKFAKEGDKIIDTHGGSMSSAIACYDGGFDLDICEIDKEYFDAGVKRFEIHKSQMKLF